MPKYNELSDQLSIIFDTELTPVASRSPVFRIRYGLSLDTCFMNEGIRGTFKFTHKCECATFGNNQP